MASVPSRATRLARGLHIIHGLHAINSPSVPFLTAQKVIAMRFPAGLIVLMAVAAAGAATVAADDPGRFSFTEPNVTIHVAFSQPGLIKALEVQEGDPVTAGQLLAALDDQVLAVTESIARARAADDSAVTGADAEAVAVRRRLEELRSLRDVGGASPEEVRRVETELAVAEANHKKAVTEHAIQQLDVKRIVAERDQRRLLAPISGIVTEIQKRPGEYVPAIDPEVLELVQLDPLKAKFYLPVETALTLQSGQAVKLTFLVTEQVAAGRIDKISPVVDPESGTTLVEVTIPNPDAKYRSGLKCTMSLQDLTDQSDNEHSSLANSTESPR